jgi:ABC-type transport system substrate-binding protein
VPPNLWSYDPDVVEYDYDPATARALLAKAAADGAFDESKRYRFYVLSTPRSYLPDPEQIARVLQRNLEDVGIHTELVVQDLEHHEADIRAGKHDLCLFGWTADNGDPDNFLKVLLDGKDSRDEEAFGGEQNDAFYRNGEVHGLLVWAEETQDQEERAGYYRRAQEIIARDAPWVPLAHSELAVAARNEVEGLVLHPTGTVFYQKVRLER